MNDLPKSKLRNLIGWWALWSAAFLASLIPPAVHYWRRLPDIIEPFRYPWHLLPSDLLMLRWLGELSCWIPGVLLAILFGSVRWPRLRRVLIATGASLAAAFSSVYAGYTLLIVTTYLPSYSNAMNGREDMLQAFYVRQKSAEQAGTGQPATRPESKSEGGDKPQPEAEGRSR